MRHHIDSLRGPLFVSWQITRDCDLCCLHCCTESAPGKALADELDAEEAMRVAEDIVRNDVPYVMLAHRFLKASAVPTAPLDAQFDPKGE